MKLQMTVQNKKWVHFIGIAGVATGQLAVEFKNNDWIVTGSDRGLFPPMSTYIQGNGINIELGYKPEHISGKYYAEKYLKEKEYEQLSERTPDLIVLGGTKGFKNPEYIRAKELGLDIQYYPDVLASKVIKPNESIIVAGTYGKSTITSMLVDIFATAHIPISWMYGALASNGNNGVKFSNSETRYSVVEGDEYIHSIENPKSKFFSYSPKYLILTATEWDHTDIFKSKGEYVENYRKLIEMIPENGVIIYDNLDPVVKSIVKYSPAKKIPINRSFDFTLNVLGSYNKKNADFALTLCDELRLPISTIINALKNYSGIKRRLEIRSENANNKLIDDFGASAPKAKKAIDAVRSKYSESNIVAVFEPNLGSRTREGIDEYANVFNSANKIIFPRFTRVKGEYISPDELGQYISRYGTTADVILNDDDLILEIKEILESTTKNNIILFLGSHGFRGMIERVEELIN